MPLGLGSYRVDYRQRGAKKWHKWGDYVYKKMAESVAKRRDDADYETRVVKIKAKKKENNPMAKRRTKNAARKWNYLGYIGDSNPIEHWGGIIRRAPHGDPQLLYFQSYEDRVSIYQVEIPDDVTEEYDWVDWKGVADYWGESVAAMKKAGRSKNIEARAQVLEGIGSYHGWQELDYSPEDITIAAAERKYGQAADAAYKASHKAHSRAGARNPRKKNSGTWLKPSTALPKVKHNDTVTIKTSRAVMKGRVTDVAHDHSFIGVRQEAKEGGAALTVILRPSGDYDLLAFGGTFRSGTRQKGKVLGMKIHKKSNPRKKNASRKKATKNPKKTSGVSMRSIMSKALK